MAITAYCNQGYEKLTSPIKYVIRFLPHALANIAPEKYNELITHYMPLRLVADDTHIWKCCVDTKNREIKISRGLIEMLWCASYAYYLFYSKHVVGMSFFENRVAIDIQSDREVDQALQLLAWAYDRSTGLRQDVEWPPESPAPSENMPLGSFEAVASELCLCAVAVLLHHELAHLNFQEDQFDTTVLLERNVDYAAIDWILGSCENERSAQFIKRSFGIAVAFEVLTAHDIYRGSFTDLTHPSSYDRLINNLDRYITDPNHITWAFTCAMLTLHFNRAQIQLPLEEFASFRECVNAFADILSRK